MLYREGVIEPGTVITLLPSSLPSVEKKIDTNAPECRATFAEDVINVIWEKDGTKYTLSKLCGHMRDEYGFPFPPSVNGYQYWSREDDDIDLSTLAESYR